MKPKPNDKRNSIKVTQLPGTSKPIARRGSDEPCSDSMGDFVEPVAIAVM